MNIDLHIDKIMQKILVGLAEVGIIFLTSVLSILASVMVYFLRSKIFTMLSFFGITYFQFPLST